MKSRARRSRRKSNKTLQIILGVLVAIIAIILIAVGVKFVLGGNVLGKGDSGKDKEEEKVETILVTGVELTCDRPVVRAGEELPLNVTVTPENATDKTLTWTVSGDMGKVENNVFIPSEEAAKSDVELTATANDGTKVFANLTVRVLEAIDPSKPMIAITYDDGPSAANTPKVLDALEKTYGVATFFMLGQNIDGKEEIIKRSYNMGNEMANHTYDHKEDLRKLSEDAIKQQVEDTEAKIKAICNVESTIVRPPYGGYNDTVVNAIARPVIMWSVDTLDWKTRSADATYDSCMTAQDGDIILMHDIHESTAIATEDIVKGLQEKGFQLVTVSELYEYRLGDFGPGSVCYKMTQTEYKQILAEQEAATGEDGSTTAEGDTTVDDGFATVEGDSTVDGENTTEESKSTETD